MKFIISSIGKNNNEISIDYKILDGSLKKYINYNDKPIFIYDENIEKVPDSLAVIPFLGSLLPLSWILDFPIYLNSLDSVFYEYIEKIKSEYQRLIPQLSFKGKLIVNKLENNIYSTNKTALMFSGGVDAVNSLVMNNDVITDLITIWGSDINTCNVNGWNNFTNMLSKTMLPFKKKWHVVKSNFREIFNSVQLDKLIKCIHDDWWHALQHGMGIISHSVPLAYIHGFGSVFIASSFTKEFNPICASNPDTDNLFHFGKTITIHDGFEYDRCQKLTNIYNYIEKNNSNIPLRVCWKDANGENCCNCEKCIRTYLSAIAIKVDPQRIGLRDIPFKNIKRVYTKEVIFSKTKLYHIDVIRRHAFENYVENEIPKKILFVIDKGLTKKNKTFYWFLKKRYIKLKRFVKNIIINIKWNVMKK